MGYALLETIALPRVEHNMSSSMRNELLTGR
jgi:hypothetical protein